MGVVAALCLARTATAQARACAAQSTDSLARSTSARWSPPLDRTVNIRATVLSLRDALDRLATAGRLSLSYSDELLPLDRSVCLSADGAPAGRVLATLLSGTSVAAIGLGGDQVVLAPQTPARAQPEAPDMAGTLGVLDRVIVTSTAVGTPQRATVAATEVIDGRRLERDNTNTLTGALDSYTPGVWGWAQSPSNMLSSYASIRGASSFGMSYPKIYIDGVEVANPLVVTHFDPASVDRIEIIRGPQGSALYGADAISGVVNIITRQDAPNDGFNASLRSAAGTSHSAYARDVLAQSHSVSLLGGTDARSADLRVSGETLGSFVPDGFSRDLMVSGGVRSVGEHSALSATARFFTQQSGTPNSPFLPAPAGPADSLTRVTAPGPPQSVSEYTFGLNATTAPDGRWTHSFVAGIDGYRLSNAAINAASPVRSAADSALLAAEGSADRATIRATSELHIAANAPTNAVLSFSAEHSTLRETSIATDQLAPLGRTATTMLTGSPIDAWENTTGVTAQANGALANTLFGTAGVRVEQDSRLAAWNSTAVLPMLGGTAVVDRNGITVKLRAAYGRGIRPPSLLTHSEFAPGANTAAAQAAEAVARASLGPEEQAGIEGGVDVLFKQLFALHVTRFDQRASGLIQDVALGRQSTGLDQQTMQYEPENVGEIANRGWELEASTGVSHLTATGALSFVDSRVMRLAPGYNGDLQTGDRMLQVPARTASLTAAWTATRWRASLGASRAFDWINYDEIALATALETNQSSARDLSGAELRSYWSRYDGGLRVHATASRDLGTEFSIDISAENLLNYQRGEPDNITVVPGRTILTGLRLRF